MARTASWEFIARLMIRVVNDMSLARCDKLPADAVQTFSIRVTCMKIWRHLCIDMQCMFVEQTPWHVPWMSRTLDPIAEVAGRFPERTIFTRFIPPSRPDLMPGKWRDYYKKWEMMTTGRLPADSMLLVAPLRRLVPPGRIFDKLTYSP